MGYLIRMAPEVGEWLAVVRDRDPAVADLIDEAVAALRAGGESVGPPLVVPVDDPSLSGRPGPNAARERQIQMLTGVRTAAAEVAASRKRLELEARRLEHEVGRLGDQSRKAVGAGRADIAEEIQARRDATEGRLADLRRQYAAMQADEERVTAASQHLVDAFRTRGEAAKAAHTAAEAAAEMLWAEEVIDDAEGPGSAAGDVVRPEPPRPVRPSLRLSELRPGAPESAGTRILFTVEPPGTAVLLAAGVESDWLRAWYAEAIANCRTRYQREQSRGGPDGP
jgi:hypothetical protein